MSGAFCAGIPEFAPWPQNPPSDVYRELQPNGDALDILINPVEFELQANNSWDVDEFDFNDWNAAEAHDASSEGSSSVESSPLEHDAVNECEPEWYKRQVPPQSGRHSAFVSSIPMERQRSAPSHLGGERSRSSRGGMWTCPDCPGLVFGNSWKLDKHAKDTRHKAWKCELCVKSYVRQSALARHRAAAHGQSEDHTCMVCPKAFRRKDHLQQHLREVHQQSDCLGAIRVRC